MKEIKSVEIHDGKVTLVVVERDFWGAIRKRQQMTFRQGHFEKALTKADITVPWTKAGQ